MYEPGKTAAYLQHPAESLKTAVPKSRRLAAKVALNADDAPAKANLCFISDLQAAFVCKPEQFTQVTSFL